MAVAVAMSFIAASALNVQADNIYLALRTWLRRFERDQRLVGDEALSFGKSSVLVCGMGRVGTGAYDALVEQYGEDVVGIDASILWKRALAPLASPFSKLSKPIAM